MNFSAEPSITILVQPKEHGQRFRYKCESRLAGCLIGEGSTGDNKVYPTIKINNLNGQSAIVVVSCVSKERPYYPHPHNLVGTDCKDGVCTIRLKPPNEIAVINGVGVQCCKRQDIDSSLAKRQELRVDPFSTGRDPSSKIDLSVVRLCFQVFLPDANRKFTRIIPPVVTVPIVDKKTVRDLVITRLSATSGSVNGGDDLIILCEKVRKDEIQVRFYEANDDGDILWEAFANQDSIEVHHQYAICFKTPPYHNRNIEHAVSVMVQLCRSSSSEVGDSKPFTYKPNDPDPDGFLAKRRKLQQQNFGNFVASSYATVPSTVEDFPDDDEDTSSNAFERPMRRGRRVLHQKSDGPNRPVVTPAPTAALTTTNPTHFVAFNYPGLPVYSYEAIGGQDVFAAVNVPASDGASGFVLNESSSQPAPFSVVGPIPDLGLSDVTQNQEGENVAVFDQDLNITSFGDQHVIDDIQDLLSTSNMTEVSINDLQINSGLEAIFNSQDGGGLTPSSETGLLYSYFTSINDSQPHT